MAKQKGADEVRLYLVCAKDTQDSDNAVADMFVAARYGAEAEQIFMKHMKRVRLDEAGRIEVTHIYRVPEVPPEPKAMIWHMDVRNCKGKKI